MSIVNIGSVGKQIEGRVNQIAAGILASKLGSAIAKNTGKSTWGLFLAETVDRLGEGYAPGDAGQGVVDLGIVFADVKAAIEGKAVAAFLADSGYGALNSIVTDENGKEGIDTRAGNFIASRYGSSFKLSRIRKAAVVTLQQYYDNVRRAVVAGVTLDSNMTMRSLDDARKAAELASLSDAELVARQQADDENKNATQCGSAMASAYKAGDQVQREALDLTGVIMGFWSSADAVLQAAFHDNLQLWADKFNEARIAATPNAADEEPTAEGMAAAMAMLEQSISEDEAAPQAANG